MFIDNEFYAGISLETALKYRLTNGMELSSKKLSEIVFESNKIEALTRSINYVTKSLKTKKQLKFNHYDNKRQSKPRGTGVGVLPAK